MTRLTIAVLCCTLWGVGGCADGAPSGVAGPAVEVDVAALNLVGVGDVVWDLEVVNHSSQVVWQRRITSTSHGDSAGSASYVGPCDADDGPDTVKVWVVGVYDGDIVAADAGSFASGADIGAGAVTGTSVPFQNPTSTTSPLTREVACTANADVAVQFDVTLARPAQQGFFDVAVSFNDIFCSAKKLWGSPRPGDSLRASTTNRRGDHDERGDPQRA